MEESRHGLREGRRYGVLLCWILACSLTAGCGHRQAGTAKTPPVEAPPLARVGDARITEEDFAFEVQRRTKAGAPVESAQALLQDLIQREAMLQEARRAPWIHEPEAKRERDNQLLVQWLDRALQAEEDRVAVTDGELRAYYDAHRGDVTRPAVVRLAMLYRRVSPQEAEAAAKEMEATRTAYLADRATSTRNGRIPGFGTLAAQASEDAVSRYRGGDLGWLEPGRKDYRWPGAVLDTGFALPKGGVSDILKTEEGLYVVMKCDERDAQVTPFEEASVALRRRLVREKQEALEKDFVRGLLARAKVEVNADRAARLTVRGAEPHAPPPAVRSVAKLMAGPPPP